MDDTINKIMQADAKTAARYASAAIKRLGQLGEEAAEEFAKMAEGNAADPEFEDGFSVINS